MTPRPSIANELNARIDCEDLAYKLGLERPGDRSNFRSPHHADKMPSLSVYRDADGRSKFKDFSQDVGGGPIDLYMHVRQGSVEDAIAALREMYPHIKVPGYPPGAGGGAKAGGPPRERTLAEWIGDKCLDAARDEANRARIMAYLTGRGIAEKTVEHALARRSLGFNTWTSPTVAAGEVGHGGEAVAFIVNARETGEVVAVDMRYIDPALNGGMKTQSQGEKEGRPWCSDWRRFDKARRVYVVESAINALSVDSCNLPATAAVAVRGTGTVENMDWRMFIGKTVVLAFDNDKPLEHGPNAGYCPGLKAAWSAHEALLALDVPALMVSQDDWTDDDGEPINDVNDFLQLRGTERLAAELKKLEQWLIPGMHGKNSAGRPRIFLPYHDFSVYWRYRVREDFTSFVDKFKKDEETGKEDFELSNVCGFRVAGISRVRIASVNSMMSGDKDLSPHTLYSISAQVPRESDRLLRRVVTDENVHNLTVWQKLGPVFSPAHFSRMVNILERSADLGARDAINFVGIAWKYGKAVVNEARDCYFTDPSQQCPYWNLVFPSGSRDAAARVIRAYQGTFGANGAALMLVWALGAHLKAFVGFWPHFAVQADKGTGKDVLTKRLERTVGMQIFSRQTMQTEFRILGSVSFTSHPVGWGEFSANKRDILAKAMHTLQESYQFTYSTRGTEKKEFLLCAPVLLVGEEIDARTLQGKLVRNKLSKTLRGNLMDDDLPVFPVRQWLDYLAATPKARIVELQKASLEALTTSCAASRDDAGADRMVQNYAVLRTAWTLLCDFAGLDLGEGGFLRDLTAEMNEHVRESVGDRQPWVWIVETLLSEIARGTFKYPFAFDDVDGEPILAVRSGHVMDHIAREHSLREFFDALPVKSDRVFKRALQQAGVLAADDIERTVRGQRVGHMVALSLPALEQYGLHAVQPVHKPGDEQ